VSPARTKEPGIAPVVWHDLECGSYAADLPVWRDLAARAARGRPSEVLDLGCGTGRVALDLAAHGHRVTGLDTDRRLVDELRRRATERNISAGAVVADARDFDLGRRFDVVLAAMQFIQLLRDPPDRAGALRSIRWHLRPGGCFAAALLDLSGESTNDDFLPPPPDMRESYGWVWSSQAVEVRLLDDGALLALDRHRRAVSPQGEIAESDDSVRLTMLSCEELEDEMQEAGIEPVRRQQIPPTDEHIGSIVVFGEVPRG
jgi:SAM-dependent methyltransferase